MLRSIILDLLGTKEVKNTHKDTGTESFLQARGSHIARIEEEVEIGLQVFQEFKEEIVEALATLEDVMVEQRTWGGGGRFSNTANRERNGDGDRKSYHRIKSNKYQYLEQILLFLLYTHCNILVAFALFFFRFLFISF
jgi:hypothetical protein